jgi:hypothetical protein
LSFADLAAEGLQILAVTMADEPLKPVEGIVDTYLEP